VCVCLLIYILSLLKIKGEKSFYQIKLLDELKLVKMCEQCKCIVFLHVLGPVETDPSTPMSGLDLSLA
jgi:hypothetical protein